MFVCSKIDYEDGLPVKLEVCTIGQYPWHTHNDIQMVYVLEGEIEIKNSLCPLYPCPKQYSFSFTMMTFTASRDLPKTIWCCS